MFRPIDLKILIRGQSLVSPIRAFSIQPAKAPSTESKFQDEWNTAKPFKSIPSMSMLQITRRFMPGGKHKAL